MANTVTINVRAKDQASSEIEGLKNRLTSLSTTKGFQSVVQGIGMGAGIAAFGLLKSAISDVPQALMGAVSAAADEQVGIEKLTASLKANVIGWDGNRTAIENVIAKRMDLAFSDDEQRESLALLVARTKDVNAALALQGTAMDLARLKSIPLGDASRALAMALGGQGRALKELGINAKDYADKQELIAAVQKVSTGQAEAYARTAKGSFEALNIALEDTVEEIGAQLLPVALQLATTLKTDVLPAVKDLSTNIGPLAEGFGFVADAINLNLNPGQAIKDMMEKTRLEAVDTLTASLAVGATAWDTMAERSAASRESVAAGAAGVGLAADETERLKTNLDLAREAWDLLNGRIKANDEFANLPDKITVAKDAARKALAELTAAIEGGNSVVIAAARIRLRDAEAELAGLRREYAQLRVEMERSVTVGGVVHNTNENPEPRAWGGPVFGGRTYLVGERGPELFTPGSSGGITPNGGFGGLTLTAGAIVVNGSGDPEAVARSVMLALKRETQRQGMSF